MLQRERGSREVFVFRKRDGYDARSIAGARGQGDRSGSRVMGGKAIIPKGTPKPIAPYSPAIKAGNAVYVAGMVALDRGGKRVGVNDVAGGARHVIETIADILKEAGGSLADIAFNTIILKDLADYAK